MSQPTTVREYSGPRPKQPGTGPLITFPESHGLPVRLAASGWLGIPCLPSSEFRARFAGGHAMLFSCDRLLDSSGRWSQYPRQVTNSKLTCLIIARFTRSSHNHG